METRYAIIIGINDYVSEPLSYCVNDGNEVKEALVSRANFNEKNIYTVLSSAESPVKDVTGMLLNAITRISEVFHPEEDSIFFYYAGHGVCVNDQSNLVFHDSTFQIKAIFDKLTELKPKIQYYVFDACESGSKTLARGLSKISKEINLDEYISASSGIMFLYACQNTEQAFEVEKVKHGIMTYYFIKAIKNDALYDEDGILTPGRIQEYVSKNVAKESKFLQNPVVESRITGFYPFATKSGHILIDKEFENVVPASDVRQADMGQLQNITYDRSSRLMLQQLAFSKVKATLENVSNQYSDKYVVNYYSSLNELPVENADILLSKIVSDATDKLNAINKTIYYKKVPVYEKKASWTISLEAMLGDRVVKEYRDEPKIDYENEYLSSIIFIAKSNSIQLVSFGVGCVIYQAKWGMVISPFCFMIDWDGEKDCLISGIRKENYAYLINQESFNKIDGLQMELIENIPVILDIWNKKRNDELDNFEKNKK